VAGARAYLEGVQRLLDQLGTGPAQIDVNEADDQGHLTASLLLAGGYRLEADARLTFADRPEVYRYSFQLLDSNSNQVLRFDNEPHHPRLTGFPHHLHQRGQPVGGVSPAPSIRVILAAIQDEIEFAQAADDTG